MNDLQKTEFEMLRHVISVCDKLGLTYYLVCGSALGAAKYGGFIPWDDDIDIALRRDEYEIFLEKAAEMLPDWCFVQNYRTEPHFHLIGTKIRDSRTTYVEQLCDELNINHGVFIDVFPLDYYISGKKEQRRFQRMQARIEGLRRIRLRYRRFTSREVFKFRNNYYYIMYKLFGMYKNTPKYMAMYEEVMTSDKTGKSGILCNHANSISPIEYASEKQYGKGTMMKFEGLDVRVPELYDEYLTQKYGDWRGDLPEDQQKGHHFFELQDLERPYVEYIEKISRNKEKIRLKKR